MNFCFALTSRCVQVYCPKWPSITSPWTNSLSLNSLWDTVTFWWPVWGGRKIETCTFFKEKHFLNIFECLVLIIKVENTDTLVDWWNNCEDQWNLHCGNVCGWTVSCVFSSVGLGQTRLHLSKTTPSHKLSAHRWLLLLELWKFT
jgi:hypothetical protein